MENGPWPWAETQLGQTVSQSKRDILILICCCCWCKECAVLKSNMSAHLLHIVVSHSEPPCCTSAEEYKRLCALFSQRAGSNSQTRLPGIPGLHEGSEPETKPLAPVLLSPRHSASALSMGGVSSQLQRGSRGPHSPRSPLTRSGPLRYTERKHTTLPPTQYTMLHRRWALPQRYVNPAL